MANNPKKTVEPVECVLQLGATDESNPLWTAFRDADSMIRKERGIFRKYMPREDNLAIEITDYVDEASFDFVDREILLPSKLFEGAPIRTQQAMIVGAVESYYVAAYNSNIMDTIEGLALASPTAIPTTAVAIHIIKNQAELGTMGCIISGTLGLLSGLVLTMSATKFGLTAKVAEKVTDKKAEMNLSKTDLFVLSVIKDKDAVIDAITRVCRFNGDEHPFARIARIEREFKKHPELYATEGGVEKSGISGI